MIIIFFCIRSLLLIALFFITSETAHAEIYKCINNDGRVNYSGSPCSGSNQQATLNLDSVNVSESNNKIKIDGVLIVGTQKFRDRITEAMALIKSSSPSSYLYVTTYVGKIEQSLFSGMAAYKNPPTFHIGDKISFGTLTWCAGSIVHDAYHSFLYHDYIDKNGMPVPYDAWGGFESEKKANAEEMKFLVAANAPAYEIEHLKKDADGTHGDTNKDGKLTKEDGWLSDW